MIKIILPLGVKITISTVSTDHECQLTIVTEDVQLQTIESLQVLALNSLRELRARPCRALQYPVGKKLYPVKIKIIINI